MKNRANLMQENHKCITNCVRNIHNDKRGGFTTYGVKPPRLSLFVDTIIIDDLKEKL